MTGKVREHLGVLDDSTRPGLQPGGSGWSSTPNTLVAPLVGLMSPRRQRMVVVLPDPFGPRYPCTEPGLPRARSKPSTATTSVAPALGVDLAQTL